MWPRGWVEVQLYSSMTAALKGGEWSAARPGRTLPPGKTQSWYIIVSMMYGHKNTKLVYYLYIYLLLFNDAVSSTN